MNIKNKNSDKFSIIILIILFTTVFTLNSYNVNAAGFWWWSCDEVGDDCCDEKCNEGLICGSNNKCKRNEDAKGFLDVIDCNSIAGWACDEDTPSTVIEVSFTNYRTDGSHPHADISPVAASQSRPDIASVCGGNPNHGFSFPTPNVLKDGGSYSLNAYAKDSSGIPRLLGSKVFGPCAGGGTFCNGQPESSVSCPQGQTRRCASSGWVCDACPVCTSPGTTDVKIRVEKVQSCLPAKPSSMDCLVSIVNSWGSPTINRHCCKPSGGPRDDTIDIPGNRIIDLLLSADATTDTSGGWTWLDVTDGGSGGPSSDPDSSKSACENAGFEWTGSRCCGNNAGEYYNEVSATAGITGGVVAGSRITGFVTSDPVSPISIPKGTSSDAIRIIGGKSPYVVKSNSAPNIAKTGAAVGTTFIADYIYVDALEVGETTIEIEDSSVPKMTLSVKVIVPGSATSGVTPGCPACTNPGTTDVKIRVEKVQSCLPAKPSSMDCLVSIVNSWGSPTINRHCCKPSGGPRDDTIDIPGNRIIDLLLSADATTDTSGGWTWLDVTNGGSGGSGGEGGGTPTPPPETVSPSSVNWIDANVGGWAETAKLSVNFKGDQVCLNYDKASVWEEIDGVVGNVWFIANINGKWYGSTWEWMRPGQSCKSVTNLIDSPTSMKGELKNFRVVSGETYGFMVSTYARSNVGANGKERSNIVMVTWTGPTDSGGGGSDTGQGGLGGCWNSKQVISISFVEDSKNSVLNYKGQFYGCAIDKTNYNKDNDQFLPIQDSHTKNQLIKNQEYCTYTPDKNYYCSYTEKWEQTNGKDKSHLSTSPLGNPKQKSDCCAATECWDGQTCIENQKDKPLAPLTGENYKCVDGNWKKLPRKCTPDESACGYCGDETQCLLNPQATTNQCMNSGEYSGDDYCDNGQWGTRTKLLALKLLSMKATNYVFFCDNKQNTLNNLKYVIDSGETAETVIANLQANNFCVLKTNDKIIVATSINKNLEEVKGGFNILGVTSCNNAKDDGNYYPCDNANRVWYNKRLKSFIYSQSPITVTPSQESVSSLSNMIISIIDIIKRLITPPPFDESYVKSIKRFDKLFLAQQGQSSIRGSMEGKVFKNAVIEYNTFDKINICAYVNSFNEAGKFSLSGISCRKEGNNYYVLAQGSEFTNFNPENVWTDLTAKLRLK